MNEVDLGIRRSVALPPVRWRALVHLFLSADARQQLRIKRSLIATANYIICTLIMMYAMEHGGVDRQQGISLAGYMLTQSLAFYLVLRSGVNLRFPDPSLTFPQIMVSITCVVGAYAVLRASRGAALMLLAMVLIFGLFNLSARQVRFAALFALGLLGVTQLLLSQLNPLIYAPDQEFTYFLFACSTLPTISLLSGDLSNLRDRLRARKEELADALGKIQHMATRDELTGVYNRRFMQEALARQALVADNTGSVFCVVLLDLDHFKRVNDTHGHGVGDEVLKSFAEVLSGSIGSQDLFARWGGEEFMLMLAHCRVDQAQACLQRIQEKLTHCEVSRSCPDMRVTFSAGIYERGYREEVATVIERSDVALYRAKHLGRNRAVAFRKQRT